MIGRRALTVRFIALHPSHSDCVCVYVCATCVMVIESDERLLSHRMVDDIRVPAYH